MTMLHGAWRSAALEVVEQVSDAVGRSDALCRIFSTLQRTIAFDCASAISLEGAEFYAFDKPEVCRRAWAENAARYLHEGRRVLEVAVARQGVVRDSDVLSARERDRSTFYDEYMRPLGARGCVLFLVQGGPSITQILSLTRTGTSPFRDRELETLRLLHPAMSVAARVFTGASDGREPFFAPPSPLSRREAQIADYLVRGLQNTEIASCLGTSKYTVRNQIQRIFLKLDVSTRAELVAVLLANGWTRGFHQSESDVQVTRGRQ